MSKLSLRLISTSTDEQLLKSNTHHAPSSRITSSATCCSVSLAPFVRVRQRSKQRARALRCAARVARGTEAEACILVRIPLHDELGEQLF